MFRGAIWILDRRLVLGPSSSGFQEIDAKADTISLPVHRTAGRWSVESRDASAFAGRFLPPRGFSLIAYFFFTPRR